MATTTAMCQIMPEPRGAAAAAQRGLPVEEVEAFGRGDAALRGSASLTAGAAIGARTTLERHLRRLTPPVARHPATQVASPVPAAPPGPLPSRGCVARSLVGHVTHSPCISGAMSCARSADDVVSIMLAGREMQPDQMLGPDRGRGNCGLGAHPAAATHDRPAEPGALQPPLPGP